MRQDPEGEFSGVAPVCGLSEQIIGCWFAAKSRDVTERVVLASKGPFSGGQDVNAAGLSRASDMHTLVEKTLSFLDGAVKAG